MGISRDARVEEFDVGSIVDDDEDDKSKYIDNINILFFNLYYK